MLMFHNGTCTDACIRLGFSLDVFCYRDRCLPSNEFKLSKEFERGPACVCIKARLRCGHNKDGICTVSEL